MRTGRIARSVDMELEIKQSDLIKIGVIVPVVLVVALLVFFMPQEEERYSGPTDVEGLLVEMREMKAELCPYKDQFGIRGDVLLFLNPSGQALVAKMEKYDLLVDNINIVSAVKHPHICYAAC